MSFSSNSKFWGKRICFAHLISRVGPCSINYGPQSDQKIQIWKRGYSLLIVGEREVWAKAGKWVNSILNNGCLEELWLNEALINTDLGVNVKTRYSAHIFQICLCWILSCFQHAINPIYSWPSEYLPHSSAFLSFCLEPLSFGLKNILLRTNILSFVCWKI